MWGSIPGQICSQPSINGPGMDLIELRGDIVPFDGDFHAAINRLPPHMSLQRYPA